jgi:hypothetical protein
VRDATTPLYAPAAHRASGHPGQDMSERLVPTEPSMLAAI